MFRISALALCLVASPALAQSASDRFRQQFDPGDPAVTSAPVEYRSVFGSEKPKQPDITWPAANEEMSKLRGHAGHIREPETGQGAAGATPLAAPSTSPHHQH